MDEIKTLSPKEQEQILATGDEVESHKRLPPEARLMYLHLAEALRPWAEEAIREGGVRPCTPEEAEFARICMVLEAEEDPEFREWLIRMDKFYEDLGQ
jgi:hypothetical protein